MTFPPTNPSPHPHSHRGHKLKTVDVTAMHDDHRVLRDICHTCGWISDPYDGGPIPLPDTTVYSEDEDQ